LPKLLPLGRKRALLLTGLVWATWHMPLIYLTVLLPIGNPVIGVPLFYAAVVAGSFFYGYLRLASGSLWPSSIAHATHNSAWGIMVGFTATSSPLLVNGYLLGDFGIVITVAAAIGAALVSRLVPPGGEEVRRGKDKRSIWNIRRKAGDHSRNRSLGGDHRASQLEVLDEHDSSVFGRTG
jgi:hypothetical protein